MPLHFSEIVPQRTYGVINLSSRFTICKNNLIYFKDFIDYIANNHTDKIMDSLVLNSSHNSDYWLDLLDKAQHSINAHHIKSINYIDNIIDAMQPPHNDNSTAYTQLVVNTASCLPNDEFNISLINIYNAVASSSNIDTIVKHKEFITNIATLLTKLSNLLSFFYVTVEQLGIFTKFKNITHSAVIIGANGSGKSSFSRRAKNLASGNVIIISAQKIFWCNTISNLPISDTGIQKVHNYQAEDKLHNVQYKEDLNNIMLALIGEHFQQADNYYNYSKNGQAIRKKSKLEEVMEAWGEIIKHRKMIYKNPHITICTDNDSVYHFTSLSDGEKAIFYYAAHILLAKENAFIVIDEPENHLHMAVVTRLWDKLEKLRADCRFIYLTHDLNFASSRTHADKFWSKSYTVEHSWNIIELPTDNALPEALLMEILGSQQKILFCEGCRSSIDYTLYHILFPKYNIIPIYSSDNVISYTRACNKSKNIFGNAAIGLIDLDYRDDNEIAQLKLDSIYCLDVHEVENILCDELLIKASIKEFCSNTTFDQVKNRLFEEIRKDKEKQVIKHATHVINSTLKSNLLGKAKTAQDLETKFSDAIDTIHIKDIINERTKLIEQIIEDNHYDNGIKYYDNKGLPGILGGVVVNDYTKRILKLLEKDKELVIKLRERHFSAIPTN